MTAADGLIQWAAFILGALGAIVYFNLEDKSRHLKIASLVWTVVWAGPPLVRLWIAMVMA